MNGPWFDLEAIWEEHTGKGTDDLYSDLLKRSDIPDAGHEFFTRSVAKTMGVSHRAILLTVSSYFRVDHGSSTLCQRESEIRYIIAHR